MHTATVIMAAVLLPCALIVYAILLHLVKPTEKFLLGAKLPEGILESAEVSELTKSFKRRSGIVMLVLSLLLVATIFVPWFSVALTFQMTWTIFLTVLPFLYVGLYNKKLITQLDAQSGNEHWVGGFFYHDPDDKRILIEQRDGINSTFNLARPASKAIIVLICSLLLIGPGVGIWLMTEEFSVLTLSAEGGIVAAVNRGTRYDVSIDEIETVALLGALPENLRRSNGSNLPARYKGIFQSGELGRATLCLNPEAPPFILIRTADETYIFGTDDKNETELLYEAILEVVNAG